LILRKELLKWQIGQKTLGFKENKLKKIIIFRNKASLEKYHNSKSLSKYSYIYNESQKDIEQLLDKFCKNRIFLSNYKEKFGKFFFKEYIDFIGKLSQKYNSLYWWASSIPEKNTFISKLHKKIYYCYIISKIILNENIDYLLIYGENNETNRVIINFCNQKRILLEDNYIETNIANNKSIIIPNRLKLRKYIEKIRDFLRIQIKNYKKNSKKNKFLISKDNSYYVIRTWFDQRTAKSIIGLNDTYFGRLPKYLIEKGKHVILLAGSLEGSLVNLRSINTIYKENFKIIPEKQFIKRRDYIQCFLLTTLLKIKISSPILFQDINVTTLILEELNRFSPSKIRNSILHGLYVKRLASKINIESFIYTFENHSWEKTLICYLRKKSPQTNIIGYQHARVMKSLLNYFPSKFEKNLIPLPDRIITVGDHPKNILQKYGTYRSDIIVSGCALRYEYLYQASTIPQKDLKTVLIALTASLDESVEIVKFVQAGLKNEVYIPRYRCHPLISFKSIKNRLGNEIEGEYEVSKEPNLKKDFLKCETIIYTVSTVCMEALMLGLPVIHIDLGAPINGDPLFECDFLKWVAKKPKDLSIILNKISNLNSEQFLSQQQNAIRYLKDYFKRVNESNLEIFLEVV